jgi:hypothetical protein
MKMYDGIEKQMTMKRKRSDKGNETPPKEACTTPRHDEPPTLSRQHSGIGDAYSVVPSTNSISIVSRYNDEPEVNYDEADENEDNNDKVSLLIFF